MVKQKKFASYKASEYKYTDLTPEEKEVEKRLLQNELYMEVMSFIGGLDHLFVKKDIRIIEEDDRIKEIHDTVIETKAPMYGITQRSDPMFANIPNTEVYFGPNGRAHQLREMGKSETEIFIDFNYNFKPNMNKNPDNKGRVFYPQEHLKAGDFKYQQKDMDPNSPMKLKIAMPAERFETLNIDYIKSKDNLQEYYGSYLVKPKTSDDSEDNNIRNDNHCKICLEPAPFGAICCNGFHCIECVRKLLIDREMNNLFKMDNLFCTNNKCKSRIRNKRNNETGIPFPINLTTDLAKRITNRDRSRTVRSLSKHCQNCERFYWSTVNHKCCEKYLEFKKSIDELRKKVKIPKLVINEYIPNTSNSNDKQNNGKQKNTEQTQPEDPFDEFLDTTSLFEPNPEPNSANTSMGVQTRNKSSKISTTKDIHTKTVPEGEKFPEMRKNLIIKDNPSNPTLKSIRKQSEASAEKVKSLLPTALSLAEPLELPYTSVSPVPTQQRQSYFSPTTLELINQFMPENTLRGELSRYLAIDNHTICTNVNALVMDCNQKTERIKNLEEKLKSEATDAKCNKDLADQYRGLNKNLREEVEQFRKADVYLKNQIEKLNEDLKVKENENSLIKEELNKKKEEFETALSQSKLALVQRNSEVCRLNTEVCRLNDEINDYKTEIRERNREIALLQSKEQNITTSETQIIETNLHNNLLKNFVKFVATNGEYLIKNNIKTLAEDINAMKETADNGPPLKKHKTETSSGITENFLQLLDSDLKEEVIKHFNNNRSITSSPTKSDDEEDDSPDQSQSHLLEDMLDESNISIAPNITIQPGNSSNYGKTT